MLRLALAALAALIAVAEPAAADPRKVAPDDRVIGDRSAPATIIEYASLTCPHCRRFHLETLPRLKSDYMDTGGVKLVFRDFPLDRLALAAAALARCADPRSTGPVEALFAAQPEWIAAGDPIEALVAALARFGMDRPRAESCLADEAAIRATIEQAQAGQDAFAIDSTPTFIVDGTRMEGAQSFEAFAAALGAPRH